MRLFVFPLGQTLLHPGTSKPLNVFEPRYLRMVRDSIEENIPIAVGFTDAPIDTEKMNVGDPIPQLRSVAGFGMPEILEQRMDGTLLVLIPGEGKAEINHVSDSSRPYLVVNAERIDENHELKESYGITYLNLHRLLVTWIGRHITDKSTQEQFVQSLKGPSEVVGAAVAYLIRDPDMQQLILETNDINNKLDLISGIMSTARRDQI